MIKFRLYYDKDKETTWLNEMSRKGYAMTGFFAGFYDFEKCEPGQYIYQVDIGDRLFKTDDDYRRFMAEMNVEIVQQWGLWIILRKKSSEGEFQLYTDVDSSITHYCKIHRMFKIGVILELICFIMETLAAAAGNSWAIAFMFLLGLILIAMMRALFRTKQIISGLRERKGDFSEKDNCRNQKISPLIPCGLLLNTCSLLLQDTIFPVIRMIVCILAIFMMIAGLFFSRNGFQE